MDKLEFYSVEYITILRWIRLY